jgi:hypothetical protein
MDAGAASEKVSTWDGRRGFTEKQDEEEPADRVSAAIETNLPPWHAHPLMLPLGRNAFCPDPPERSALWSVVKFCQEIFALIARR